MQEGKLKVKLIAYSQNAEQVVAGAIRQCYSSVGAEELVQKISSGEKKRLIKMVLASGHTSTLEHASFTFAIEGISRACSHQLVRHRIASYSQQSQRYVDFSSKGLTFIVPPSIKNNPLVLKEFKKILKFTEAGYFSLRKKGINPEDARFVLPQAVETKIVVTMNARELLHFFELRLCKRAQWEIRELAKAMLKEVKKIAPTIFAIAGPTCETQKICWEGKFSCGKWQKIKGGQLKERI
ncbi:MAG: FAD-dependent thymidylate synthase [Microgenomates group bacterium]